MTSGKSDADLVDALEALLLELRRRLDRSVRAAKDDIVVADELFVLAGQMDAVLRVASEHLQTIRRTVDQAARRD